MLSFYDFSHFLYLLVIIFDAFCTSKEWNFTQITQSSYLAITFMANYQMQYHKLLQLFKYCNTFSGNMSNSFDAFKKKM